MIRRTQTSLDHLLAWYVEPVSVVAVLLLNFSDFHLSVRVSYLDLIRTFNNTVKVRRRCVVMDTRSWRKETTTTGTTTTSSYR